MTLAERAKLGGAVAAARAAEKAAAVRRLVDEGECLKRAAWRAGVSYSAAKRYARRWR